MDMSNIWASRYLANQPIRTNEAVSSPSRNAQRGILEQACATSRQRKPLDLDVAGVLHGLTQLASGPLRKRKVSTIKLQGFLKLRLCQLRNI